MRSSSCNSASTELGCEVDSTFKGMGRGAGNAETELLLAINADKSNKIYGFELSNPFEKFEIMKKDLNGEVHLFTRMAKSGYPQNEVMDLSRKKIRSRNSFKSNTQ